VIAIALAAAMSTIQGLPKVLDQAWVNLRSEGKAAWDADMMAAHLTSYSRTVGGGPFVLVKTGAMSRGIVSGDGEGFVMRGPAEFQIGNQSGLLEYRLNSGTAICFTGKSGYGCAVALSGEEMRERTKPPAPSPEGEAGTSSSAARD
jgi:hypothetical protein